MFTLFAISRSSSISRCSLLLQAPSQALRTSSHSSNFAPPPPPRFSSAASSFSPSSLLLSPASFPAPSGRSLVCPSAPSRSFPRECRHLFSTVADFAQATSGKTLPSPNSTEEHHPTSGEFVSYVSQQESLPANRVPPPGVLWSRLMDTSQPFVFFDNSLAILQLHRFNPHSASFRDTMEVHSILIRPRRTGKTVFGQMWLEFMKGDPDNLLARTQLKQRHAHLFPKPGELVCVHLDFSGASMDSLALRICHHFNASLKALKCEEISISPQHSPLTVFQSFIAILSSNNLKAAIFIDEYDGLARKYPIPGMEFTQTFFEAIKADAALIPHVYVTGSSRLAIAGLFSGANNFTDLTYDVRWATVLGYAWADIECLYAAQLSMLCQLHRLTPGQLKEKMQAWYNGYYFSPDCTPEQAVYFMWAIHRFLESGKFRAFFTESGMSGILTTPSYTQECLSLLGSEISMPQSRLHTYRYNPNAAAEPTVEDIRFLLLGAGVLSLQPSRTPDMVELKVPNHDSLSSLTDVLRLFAENLPRQAVNDLIVAGQIADAIRELHPTVQAMAAAAAFQPSKVLEYHIQQAFFAVLRTVHRFLRSPRWGFKSEVQVPRSTKRADFCIWVDHPTDAQQGLYFIVEFGRVVNEAVSRLVLHSLLSEKLVQVQKYTGLRPSEQHVVRFVVAITNCAGELLAMRQNRWSSEELKHVILHDFLV